MGNAQIKPHPRVKNRKQVHWKAADRSAPPGKPELLPETEVTPDLVTLRWNRPINDGGSPISGYLVEHRRVGSPHWVRATPLPVPFPEITLSGLEPGWRYQFRVSAENAVGYSDPSESSEPITVTLQRSAVTAPKFTQEVNDTVALENEKCEFVVHFLGQPAPKVCWFKDGFEIFSSRRIRILTEHDRSILTIHQTSLSDEGEIKCTATNRAGHVSSKARLTVEAPPSIRLPRNYEDGLLFEIGEIIRLKVSVVGRPTPLVFWTHNGESIQSNDRYEIDYSDKSFSLKISEARRSDRGEYQIKAVNKLGEDTASFLVTVTDKPSPPGKARVVMTLGRSVTLSWSAPEDDGGCKIGNYIVEYYRLGWNVWLKAATSRQLSTRLGDLIEGSEYKFRIKAESPYGVSEPSEESEFIFIPDPKRGLTHPPPNGKHDKENFFEDIGSPSVTRRKKRSQSSSRVETVVDVTPDIPPIRPKRLKSKSQQQTPESSPLVTRKEVNNQINRNIFDRSSLARDLAYGTPDLKIPKDDRRISSPDEHVDHLGPQYAEPKPNHAVYNVTIEQPKEALKPVTFETKKSPSPEPKKKLIREHSATVSGSSEFMLVLYSDENDQDKNNIFSFEENSIPPPLSLSAPELSSLEQPQFPPLKNAASSTDLLHERAMMRFYEAAEAEEKELEIEKATSAERRPSYDIPKIQINSKESNDIVGLDRRHSQRRKMSAGSISQQKSKWAQKRLSLKNPTELKRELLESNLKKSPVSIDIKREMMLVEGQSTSEELTDEEFERRRNAERKTYTQSSFERKPVTSTEELKWREEYEESLSESESDLDSDMERFTFEVNRSRKVHMDERHYEEETYRPAGGLSGMKVQSEEPFEILSKKKSLPDPNFVPKPILKKTDSPSISPAVSPPSSPTKTVRALSPRPDIILQRNRSKSLAVPALPTLISSSGDESDEPKPQRKRSFSLTGAQNLLTFKKEAPKEPKQSSRTTPPAAGALRSIAAMAQISGITAASIVIPKNLLDHKKNEEETKVVADHYDHIVKSVGQRRRSNTFLDRDQLKRAAESIQAQEDDVSSNLSSNEQTPSKENLSQDSGYQSVSGYRRSSFTDHYDSVPVFGSPTRKPTEEVKPMPQKELVKPKTYDPSVTEIQPNKIPEVSSFNLAQVTSTHLPSSTASSTYTDRIDNIITNTQYETLENEHISRNTEATKSQLAQTRSASKGRRSVSRSKSPSKRGTSVSRRAVASSPGRSDGRTTQAETSSRKITSPSPIRKEITQSKRRPMLKEIMTQTSEYSKSLDSSFYDQQLLARAEIKVRSAMDWLTDMAMFSVACWLYLFDNELLAIPVLLIMVYRQLKEEIKKRIPKWLMKKLHKRKTE